MINKNFIKNNYVYYVFIYIYFYFLFRHEDFLSPPGRQDIPGSLPPLLALNPSLGQPGTEPLSPRENYMCTPANNNPDNMNSQYMSESGLDYSGVYILP